MANFDDITCSGLLTAFLMKGQVAPYSETPTVWPNGTTALATGTSHNVVLPGLPNEACVIPISGTGSPVLGGIVSTGLSNGARITLVNVGSVAIDTAANDSSSAATNRIAAAISIGVGCCVELLWVGGLFYPNFPAASS